MQVLRGRNVNDLYREGRDLLEREGERRPSRNGDVLVCPYPVMSVYERPVERVLFDEKRDCNPFFHLMESIWMLSGSDDGRWLDYFVSDFSSRYAETNGRIHGAYGARWRTWFPIFGSDGLVIGQMDQLKKIVGILRKNPEDRRAVIQMWDASRDLGKNYRDVPCNTQLYPRIRDGVMDLTVMCRSNDIVWGAYGANAVHFSFLLEYLAAGTGTRVGFLYQLSNNFHGYVDVLEKKPLSPTYCGNPYSDLSPILMVPDFEHFDSDVDKFMSMNHGNRYFGRYHNPWFEHTAEVMRMTHHHWKMGDRSLARNTAEYIIAPDWRRAVLEWMDRRKK